MLRNTEYILLLLGDLGNVSAPFGFVAHGKYLTLNFSLPSLCSFFLLAVSIWLWIVTQNASVKCNDKTQEFNYVVIGSNILCGNVDLKWFPQFAWSVAGISLVRDCYKQV